MPPIASRQVLSYAARPNDVASLTCQENQQNSQTVILHDS